MVSAYILIKTEAGQAGDVVKEVAAIEGIKSVEATTGPYDAIAQAEAADFNSLGELVVAKIQAVSGVWRTLTCLVVKL